MAIPHVWLLVGAVLFIGGPAAGQHQAPKSFVTSNGSRLFLDGKKFYSMGFNAYWMPSAITKFNDSETVDLVMAAAKRLGLNVVRTWAFNDDFPIQPGLYNQTHGRALDYIVAAAGRHGLRVVYGLSNMWAAYLGPEAWLEWAEGSAANATVERFYMSNATAELYKQHIRYVTNRVNTLTGLAYKDDPTILGWNVLNEPRCPGCSRAAMKARDRFIAALSAALKAAAPKQLTLSSTEGYFAPGHPYVTYNPGAGAQCEGEQWTAEITYFDVATTHMYYRQMESLAPGWLKPSFEFYVQYLFRKLQLYTMLAAQAGKPLLVEEFGLTRRWFGEQEIKVAFAVVADALIAAKRAGMSFMGAWFWNGAPTYQPDMGGYNIYITRPPSGRRVGLGSQAATRAFHAGLQGPSAVPNTTYSRYNASLGLTEPTVASAVVPATNQTAAALPGVALNATTATAAAAMRPVVLPNQTAPVPAAVPAIGTAAAVAAATLSALLNQTVQAPAVVPARNATAPTTLQAPVAAQVEPVILSTPPLSLSASAAAASASPATTAVPQVAATGGEANTPQAGAAAALPGSLAAPPATGHRKLLLASHAAAEPPAAAAAAADVVLLQHKLSVHESHSAASVPSQRHLTEALPAVVVQAGEDTLDDFRNAAARADCAEKAALTWGIAELGWPVDVDKYRQMVATVDLVDILAEATRLLLQDDDGGDGGIAVAEEEEIVVAATG